MRIQNKDFVEIVDKIMDKMEAKHRVCTLENVSCQVAKKLGVKQFKVKMQLSKFYQW